MLGESPREIAQPGADGYCRESLGGNCGGETRIDLATDAARVICPLVAYGGCGAPDAETPVQVGVSPSEAQ